MENYAGAFCFRLPSGFVILNAVKNLGRTVPKTILTKILHFVQNDKKKNLVIR